MKAGPRRWLAGTPLLAPALAAACAVVAADGTPWAAAGVALALAAAAWSDGRRGLLLAVLAAGLGGGLHGWRTTRLRARQRMIAQAGRLEVRLAGTVAGRPETRGGGWVAPVRVGHLVPRGAATPAAAPVAARPRPSGGWGTVWFHGRGRTPLPGTRILADARLQPPEPARNPGEFDRARWLGRQWVWAVAEAGDAPLETTGPPPWRQLAEACRNGFRTAITDGLDPGGREAAVIRAMVLGERPADDDELIGAFRDSGALHVFSVSGLHVGLVGLCCWWLLRLLHVPRRWAIPVLVPMIFGYAWLAGLVAPALRAAWMAALLLAGFLARRPAGLLNVLAAVALGALAADGSQLFLPGFQLTYGVVAAIALLGRPCTRIVAGRPVVDPFLPRALWSWWHERLDGCQRWLAGALGVSLAATAGSTPLIGWHFRFVTPVAPLASLVLIPVTLALLALALAAAALAPLAPPATRALNRLNALVARAAVAIADGAARLPGSHFNLPPAGSRPAELVVFDLPYGAAATLLDPGDGRATLLDCGDQWSARQSLLPALRAAGRDLTTLVVSHPDGGHLGGAATLCRADPPALVLLPVARARSPGFRRLLEAAPAAGATLALLRPGQSLPAPPAARWEVVHLADPADDDALADDRCAVLRLHWHGWRILFTGDTGFRGERVLLESGADLAADVLVIGRHRSDPGATAPFLARVGARVVIASHARFPPEERLDARLRARLAAGGARVFGQGETGAVILTADPARLHVRGFLDGSQAELTR